MSILVTGAAGFIGSHTAKVLLERGETVVGIDNLNPYYDPALKRARLDLLAPYENFRFVKGDIADRDVMEGLARDTGIDRIVHLAAQAGVRHSLDEPRSYSASNLVGQTEVLEMARTLGATHTVYASSSSVYGRNESIPFREDDRTDSPASFYGATKKAGELLADSYASLYGLPMTGLRFFTVYGPFGRPDMAYMIFSRKIMADQPIAVFGQGDMGRDFTYISDCVAGIVAALDNPPHGKVPHRVFNLGNDRPESLGDFIAHLERLLGRSARKNFEPMQPGDVRRTWADITKARDVLGYDPTTKLEDGLASYVDWYKEFYGY